MVTDVWQGLRCRDAVREAQRIYNEGKMKRPIVFIDLFCGAGGASTGLELALSRLKMCHKGLAINHWSVAVDTMKRNHPDIDTKQMTIEEAVPADLVPSGEVDLLWASPSCTHHNRALVVKIVGFDLRGREEVKHPEWGEPKCRRLHIAVKLGGILFKGKYADAKQWLEQINQKEASK